MKEQSSNALVLEVIQQDNNLVMSLFEQKDLSPTLRHYSQCPVSLSEIHKICQEIAALLNIARSADNTTDLKKSGQLLWDHLLTRQVKERLKAVTHRSLILLLDEKLISIPWELMYDSEEFFCLKFSLGRVVRTQQPLRSYQYRSATSALKMLILANPTNDLAAAYQEGLYIKHQFERRINKIRIDFKSSYIDTLYVKKNLRDYDIVHFAGHCEYDNKNPDNSGWVLADGRFTTTDIFALGDSLSLPILVFSNSCHSAKISDDNIDINYQEKTYSIASAFLFSGVRHYIGAIRKIEDTSSAIFAAEFYSRLIKGDSIGEALRQSRLKMVKEHGIGFISWAGYLLYGDPNFALFRQSLSPKPIWIKRKLPLLRRYLSRALLAILVIWVFVYAYLNLPSVHPGVYFKFIKSNELFTKGKNQDAILSYKDIVKKDPLFLAVYPMLAEAYKRLGDTENALKYYFDYAIYSQKKHNLRNLASAYIGIGWIYQGSGEYPKAFDFYQKALSLSKDTRDKLNEACVLRKLAVWHIDKEEYDDALQLLTKSAEINRERQFKYEHRYNLACDYFDIGLVFANKDDFPAAREFYQKSRDLFAKLKAKAELADYYFNQGEIYLFEKEYDKALECYLKGLRIDEAKADKPSIASDLNMLGELYLEMGNLDKAQDYFNQAITLAKSITAPCELAASYYNLGKLFKSKGQKVRAKEYFRQAQEIYRKFDTPDYQRIKQEFSE